MTLSNSQTLEPREITLALHAIACKRSKQETAYIACPVTGGPQFVDWFQKEGFKLPPQSKEYNESLRRNVIKPNLATAGAAVSELLQELDFTIIDPTRLYVPHWNQHNYRNFWRCVIEDNVDRVIFLDGWQLSAGCAYEFLVATEH